VEAVARAVEVGEVEAAVARVQRRAVVPVAAVVGPARAMEERALLLPENG